MKIPIWRVILFFVIVIGASLLLLPTNRELGRVFLSQRDYADAEKYLNLEYERHPQDIPNDLRYLEALDHTLDFQRYQEVADQLLREFPDDPSIHRAIGDYYENNLRLQEASAQWAEVVRLDPKDADTRDKLISYYRLTQNYDGLIQTYRTLVSQGVATSDNYLELGRLYTVRGQNEQAAQTYTSLLSRDPKNATAMLRLAEIWEAAGRTDQALALYEAAAETDPTNRDYATLYIDKAFQTGRGAEANAAMRRYLNRFPNDEQFQLEVAYRLSQEGRLDEALSVLYRIHQEDPTQPDAVQMMATIYQQQGKTEELVKLLQSYNALAPPDYQTHQMLGDLYFTAGKEKEADEEYQTSLAILESNGINTPNEQFDYLSLRQKIGTNPPTVQEVQSLFEANPYSAAVSDLTFNVAFDQGDTELADQAFQRLQTLTPDDPTLIGKEAMLFYAESKWKEAAQAYERYIQTGLATHWDLADYATALTNAYQYDKALSILEKLYAKSPDEFSTLTAITDILIEQKRYNRALYLYSQFAQTHPDDYLAYIQMADIQSGNGDTEAAKYSWCMAYAILCRKGIGTSFDDKLTAINLFINLERYWEAQQLLCPLLAAQPENSDLLTAALGIAFATENYRCGSQLLERLARVVGRDDVTYLNYRIALLVEMKCWWEAKHVLEQAICIEPHQWDHQHDYALVLMQLNMYPMAKRFLKSLYWQGDRDFAVVWDMREALLRGGNEYKVESTYFSGITKIDYQITRETASWWLGDRVRISVGANEEHHHQAGNPLFGQIPFSRDIFGVFGTAEFVANSTTTWGVTGGLPWLRDTLIPFVGATGVYQYNDFEVALNLMYNEILRLPTEALLYESTVNRVLLSAQNIYCNWFHVGASGWWEWYHLNPALNPISTSSNLGNKWYLQPFVGVVAISDVYRYIELTLQFLASNWQEGFLGAETLVDLLPRQRAIEFGVVAKQRWQCAEFEGAIFESWDYARRINMVLLRALLNVWFSGCYTGTWGFDYQIGDSGLAGLGSSWILYLSLGLVY